MWQQIPPFKVLCEFTGYTCIDSILNILKMANEYCIMLGSTNSSIAIKL